MASMGNKDFNDLDDLGRMLERKGTDVARQVGDAISKVDFAGISSSIERAAKSAARELGLMSHAPSPYVICDQSLKKHSTGNYVGAFFLGYIGLSMLPASCTAMGDAGLPGFVPMIALSALFLRMGWKQLVKARGSRQLSDAVTRVSGALGGAQSISLSELAVRVEMSMDRLRPQLQAAIAKGLIPEGHLSSPLGTETLYLTDAAYREACRQRELQPQPQEPAQGELPADAREALDVFASFATGIQQVRLRIVDDGVRSSLDGIVLRVRGLSSYLASHPACAPQLRRVVSYYLPQTTKLAESFAQLEESGSAGGNVATIKDELREALDMVDDGLTKALDNLLAEQSWDIAGDIKVMRTMLEQDGLAEGDDTLRP